LAYIVFCAIIATGYSQDLEFPDSFPKDQNGKVKFPNRRSLFYVIPETAFGVFYE